MATPTYTPIASITLGSSAASVTFSSIPQDYRDLVLVYDGETSVAGIQSVQLNNDTGSNYSLVRMFGNGSSASSSSATVNYFPLLYSGSPLTGLSVMQIMDYSATDKHKTALVRGNINGNDIVEALACRWANTSAVTELDISNENGNLEAGSTFALYGIAS